MIKIPLANRLAYLDPPSSIARIIQAIFSCRSINKALLQVGVCKGDRAASGGTPQSLKVSLSLLRADRWGIHEVLRQEPHLQFIRADHFAHEEIVRAIVTCLRRLSRCRPGFFQNDFVGFQ